MAEPQMALMPEFVYKEVFVLIWVIPVSEQRGEKKLMTIIH